MLIIGEKEEENNEVSVRKHGEGDKGMIKFTTFADNLNAKVDAMMNAWKS